MGYHPDRYRLADFLTQMDTFDIRLFSGTPRRILSFFALIKPFDETTWGYVAASVCAVFLALLVIDHTHARWNNLPTHGIVYESKNLANQLGN